MPSRALTIFWIGLAALGIGLALASETAAPEENWRYGLIVIMALVTTAGIFPATIALVGAPLRALRNSPSLYWLIMLVIFCISAGLWLVPYQPTNGRALTTIEFTYLCFLAWLFVYLLAFDMTRVNGQSLAQKLGRSRFSGILISLMLVILIFFGAETYLRLFYITTDGYGFTAMNYHWYKNFYWGHFNSLGFRDYEPLPDPVTRVAIVGDSFAVGHGIPDINESFPQILERELGAGFDVNLVAQSGWDTDVETVNLDNYPLRPNIVVLSYYLNDIDYLMDAPEQNPNSNFDFIQNEQLHWFVLNFFVPNYLYYNLYQFTSPVRAGNFISDLIAAHLDDALWGQHINNLNAMADWTRDHDAQLIVLIWPHLAAVEVSRPATQRVREFYETRGITVVDMTDILQGRTPSELSVNRFDSHPSILAQHLAADALYAEIAPQGDS